MRESYIYGPVPSRRLGLSLGVDIVPYKTCSYDCIYCQLGRSTNKTILRDDYVPVREILSQIQGVLETGKRIDYITFSGSGEPTLNQKIGEMIRRIKEMTSIRIAVLTNGSLLGIKEVRENLLMADLIIPSLDAAYEDTFERINRPHSSIKFKEMVEGLVKFSKEFGGKLWLEIMFVRGINNSEKEIGLLKDFILRIRPDKVHLNTVVRPPAEVSSLPLKREEMERIGDFFGRGCEVISSPNIKGKRDIPEDIERSIIAILDRRPCTIFNLSTSLGIHSTGLLKWLSLLEEKGKITYVEHNGKRYYKRL